MHKAKYIGPIESLKGKKALVRFEGEQLLAQFDDLNVRYHGKGLAFNWHEFPTEHFKINKTKVRSDR